ncbi:MAG: PSP1 domain-containing protein, partial [Bacteroidota bacterium]
MSQDTDKNIDQNQSVQQEKSAQNNEQNREDFYQAEHYTKLPTYNWLKDIPDSQNQCDILEVRFKNTRKEYFHNINHIRLNEGDIVAVEASPGHDIGIVSLTGTLVWKKLKQHNLSPEDTEFKKIYRKAKEADVEKWREAVSLEHQTMIKARKHAKELNLNMKIGDVEYQGDKTKAIFYYIAEERVDFRELIKVLADEFKIRIEMRQIGTRQESGRIGGIGS